MHLQYLRSIPWNPTFNWVETQFECADRINSHHEDYPQYVKATEVALNLSPDTTSGHLLSIHKLIFADKTFAGKFREVEVRVGTHNPPRAFDVSDMMLKLETLYRILTIEDVIEWYKDFETIHPFQDGNGRVGGVVVASYAKRIHPSKGWLAPNQ